ncbi:hypothetical protein ACFLXQ_00475 [Chloroflexota bacterium]
MMNDTIITFIHSKHIDSFQKLRLLLFLQRHPGTKGTCAIFAERLCLGNTSLINNIVDELQKDGLLVHSSEGWALCDEPNVSTCLECLTSAFNHPLRRQKLLAQVNHHHY